MTSAWYVMGNLSPQHGNDRVQIEFEFTPAPPDLRLSLYYMDRFQSKTLYSQRFDYKARGQPEDLESRRDWQSTEKVSFLGDVFAVSPRACRGQEIEIELLVSWNPCFAVLRWQHKGVHMHVAVRPSPPYREFVVGKSKPLTWIEAITGVDQAVLKLYQAAPSFSSSSSSDPPRNVPSFTVSTQTEQFPRRPARNDFFCQFSASCRSVSCQSESPFLVDTGVGPDLIHLVTTLARFTPFWEYHPPLPTWRLDVVDEQGVIRGYRWLEFENPELEVPDEVFPPETTLEIPQALPRFVLPFLDRPIRPPPMYLRPHGPVPPPPGPIPQPPDYPPGYIPIPPGIRAVFTTGATLLRSQPEMNHPRPRIATIPRDPNRVPNLDPAEVMRRWVVLLDTLPEINPVA